MKTSTPPASRLRAITVADAGRGVAGEVGGCALASDGCAGVDICSGSFMQVERPSPAYHIARQGRELSALKGKARATAA
jgi:hypothetical protein